MIIAEPQSYPNINRAALAARIETASETYTALMARGLSIETLRMPTHLVAANLADIAGRLRLGLESGASDQDMAADFIKLAEFEAAANVWLERRERWPHLGEAPGEVTSA